jgi:hypothetical protein
MGKKYRKCGDIRNAYTATAGKPQRKISHWELKHRLKDIRAIICEIMK